MTMFETMVSKFVGSIIIFTSECGVVWIHHSFGVIDFRELGAIIILVMKVHHLHRRAFIKRLLME